MVAGRSCTILIFPAVRADARPHRVLQDYTMTSFSIIRKRLPIKALSIDDASWLAPRLCLPYLRCSGTRGRPDDSRISL